MFHCCSVCNVEKTADLLESVSIPDVSAVELLNSFVPPTDSVSGECSSRGTEDLPYPKFCMSAGDFVEIYGRNGENQDSNGMDDGWDAVATCFFIDTAPVVIE